MTTDAERERLLELVPWDRSMTYAEGQELKRLIRALLRERDALFEMAVHVEAARTLVQESDDPIDKLKHLYHSARPMQSLDHFWHAVAGALADAHTDGEARGRGQGYNVLSDAAKADTERLDWLDQSWVKVSKFPAFMWMSHHTDVHPAFEHELSFLTLREAIDKAREVRDENNI